MIDSVGIPSEACKAKMGGKIHWRGEGENDGRAALGSTISSKSKIKNRNSKIPVTRS